MTEVWQASWRLGTAWATMVAEGASRAFAGIRRPSAGARQGAARPCGRVSPRVVMDLVALSDVMAIGLAAGITGLWHQVMAIPPAGSGLIRLELCLVAMGAIHFLQRQQGDYEVRRPLAVRRAPMQFALQFALVIAATLVVATALGSPEVWPVTWLPLWWALSVSFVALGREAACRWVEARHAAGAFNSAIAVYGAGRVAGLLSQQAATPGSGITVLGVYDDRTESGRAAAIPGGPAVTGTLDDLIQAGRQDRIDEIVIALPPAADGRLGDIITRLEHLPVSLHVVTHLASDFVDARLASHRVSALGAVGMLDVKAKPMADWAPVVKRVQDLVISVPALLLLTPLFIAIAIAIKLDSPGPVFFRQRRHGVNHRVFQVLKFRSMTVTEDGASVTQATKHDPRVTRVGRFLRRTSLDELPQLINIALGDMALVGPRPHALVHNEHYGEILERYANRHQVKPGLTGWAQINGFRGETLTPDAMQQRVVHDLWYIDNWSLWLDLRILAVTPLFGFTHQNAY